MVHTKANSFVAALILSGTLPLVLSHGHSQYGVDEGVAKTMQSNSSLNETSIAEQSYFAYPKHGGLILAHIGVMIVAWLFILPIGVTLSVARSRYTLAVQALFLVIHSIGLLFGSLYTSRTPNLYEHNIHNKFGWIVTWIVLLQCVLGLFRSVAGNNKLDVRIEKAPVLPPVSVKSPAQQQQLLEIPPIDQYRYSDDSGHFTASEPSRSLSISTRGEDQDEQRQKLREFEDAQENLNIDECSDADDVEKQGLLGNAAVQNVTSRISAKLSRRTWVFVSAVYNAIDWTSLLLGFFTLGSGTVVYGGVFRGDNIFNGLAHSVKGGIFFWYGLLTLGRWMGCFAEFGWAWNVKPPVRAVNTWKARVPSAEFVESFVIFIYGASNVWLEHLAAWGDAWSAMDFEHVSISIMFFGGGLCGMLVESSRIRDFLNSTIVTSNATPKLQLQNDLLSPPKTYSFSMNPFPGLIILLLGLMMSSHHQSSMISTMVHKQWGALFVGFAIARAVTYMLLFISPPSSYLPSRPPSELISSFCLISGGLIFIASNKNTVSAMEHHGLHAMLPFTVTVGLTVFLMAWVIIVLAIKGWAVRTTQASLFRSDMPS